MDYHILDERQDNTLCGVPFDELPSGTPIITLEGYRKGTDLPICPKCEKKEPDV